MKHFHHVVALLIGLGTAAPASALTFYSQVATIERMASPSAKSAMAQYWITQYKKFAKLNQDWMDSVATMSPATRAVVTAGAAYKATSSQNAWFAAEIAKLEVILEAPKPVVVEIGRSSTTSQVQTATVGSPVVVSETAGLVFTERVGSVERTYRETRRLLRTTTSNVVTAKTTTTIRYSDGTTKQEVADAVVNRWDTVADKAEASRTLVSERVLSAAEQVEIGRWTTPEYARSGLDRVGAEAAYRQGWTGKGVTVAVVDSGFATAQVADRPVNLLPGKCMLDGCVSTDDWYGHGTHVTGIIAAAANGAGVQGLAFNASILPVKVFGATGTTPMPVVARGVAYAASQGAKVINLSITQTGVYDYASQNVANFDANFGQAYLDAVRGGATIVAAAGNSGMNCKAMVSAYNWSATNPIAAKTVNCGFPAALPIVAGYEGLLSSDGGFIAVGAVDPNNAIASFSNRAGVTKEWYIVAPGTNVLSTLNTGGTGAKSGTSMAAPYVSAAVALLAEKFPYLKGSQLSQILFRTAVDLGAPGIDEVYGNGMLSVERAMQPVGQLRLPTGGTVTAPSRSLVATPTTATVAAAASRSQVLRNAVALDEFDRTYQVDLSGLLAVRAADFSFDALQVTRVGRLSFGVAPGSDGLRSIGYDAASGLRVSLSTDRREESSGTYVRVGYDRVVGGRGVRAGGAVDYGRVAAEESLGGLVGSSTAHMVGASAWLSVSPSEGESATVGLRVPMTTVAGSVTVRAPVGRSVDGDVIYAAERVSLAERPREVALFASYSTRVGKDGSLGVNGGMQYATGGSIAGNIGVTYSAKF